MGVRSTDTNGTPSNPKGLNERIDGHLLEYFRKNFGAGGGGTNTSPEFGAPQGISATGGVINDYTTTPGDVYRAHIFTTSGSLVVSDATSNFGSTIEWLVVAGGGAGAGGEYHGGGGGAGGYRTGTGLPVSGPTTYPVVIGAGGAAAATNTQGNDGVASVFNAPGSEGTTKFTSAGGGGGGTHTSGGQGGRDGGSGGGGTQHLGNGGAGNTPPTSPAQGYPGCGNYYATAGGGGGAGGPHPANPGPGSFPPTSGGPQDAVAGAIGVRTTIAGPNYPIGTPGPGSTTGGWLAGGGGGGGRNIGPTLPGPGGAGGGGAGGGEPTPTRAGEAGTASTGGGGGGAGGNDTTQFTGGNGGSGIVVVRYQIGLLTASQKATGGAVSYYNNKTIHTFTTSGTFTNTSDSDLTVEYVAVAGGGSGGSCNGPAFGGGGGAGGVVSNIPGLMPATTAAPVVGQGSPNALTVTVGAGGARLPQANSDRTGNDGTNTTITGPGPWSVTAYKGGAGGGNTSGANGGNGSYGSGGGGAESDGAGGAGTPGQGNSGGSGNEGGDRGGGGGGAGEDGNTDGAGQGGDGVRLPSTFHDPKSTVGAPGPAGGYYIAGGGGGGSSASTPAAGGFGGGGAGAVDAVENTGGGGGAQNDPSVGGSGASGLVLIAYPT